MKQFPLQLNKEKCIECGVCISECSYGALSVADNFPQINKEECRLCGACVEICPMSALTLEHKPTEQTISHSKGIWVFIEYLQQRIENVSLELLSKARELAQQSKDEVVAIILGTLTPKVENQLYSYGANKIIVVKDPRYDMMIEENYTRTIASLVRKYDPSIFLIGATAWGRSLSARLAATLETGLTADCTSLALEAQTNILLQSRPAFGGHLMATIKCSNHRPQMASVRPNIFKAEALDRSGIVVNEPSKECFFSDRVKCLGVVNQLTETKSIHDAQIVIGVGRGVNNPQTLEQINQLAHKLKATVGGTRGAVEKGLIEVSNQIGQTGTAISAGCYIALGISGQIQHTSGIGGCRKIVAINNDPQAPIFRHADHAVVARVEDWVPLMLEALS